MDSSYNRSDREALLRTMKEAQDIFETAKSLSVDKKQQLRQLLTEALKLSPILNEQANVLHPDLAHNLTEYITLKLEDDGADPSGWVQMYERDTQKIFDNLARAL